MKVRSWTAYRQINIGHKEGLIKSGRGSVCGSDVIELRTAGVDHVTNVRYRTMKVLVV